MLVKKTFFICQVCLAICLLVAVSAVVAEGNLDFDVPVPSGSKLLDSKDLRMGGRQIHTFLYGSEEAAGMLADYYRNFFQQQEFQKVFDRASTKTGKHSLRFKKDELVVSLAIVPREKKTDIIIAKYLEPAGAPPLEKTKFSVKDSLFALPKEDVPGKDLAGIPRPPSSIRIMSNDLGSRATAMYTTSLSVGTIVDFYRTEMPGRQWEPANEMAAKKALDAYKDRAKKKDLGIPSPFSDGESLEQIISDSYLLEFTDGSANVQVTVFPNFIDRDLGSMVQLSYKEKQ